MPDQTRDVTFPTYKIAFPTNRQIFLIRCETVVRTKPVLYGCETWSLTLRQHRFRAGEGGRGQGVRRNHRGPGPNLVPYAFVYLCTVCRLYKLTLSEQAQITLQLSQPLRVSVVYTQCKNFLAGPSVVGRVKKVLHRGPNPLSAALHILGGGIGNGVQAQE